jgi:DNA-binding NarL/FixJ family response regulator
MDNPISVAIIENNSFFRETLCHLMIQFGFVIAFEAENGKVAIDKIKSGNSLPNVCILDINMPIMNGFQTASWIKEHYPTIKIIACSLDNSKYQIEESLRSGADLFFSKAFVSADLKAAIISLSIN